MFHDFNKDINYILKRVIIGVLIALVLGFLGTRKVQALDTVTFNEWQFVYRDQTSGQTWDNTFIYRLGEQKSLLAVNIYWPSFSGYYNGTVTFQLDPVQFQSQPNGFLTNEYFKLFVYQNGSYSQQYYIGTCDGKWTCTFNFQGTASQSANSRFSVQLLINNEAFSTAYIFYPAGRVSASIFASNEANTGNQDIINNQNENTQDIINNQNENTQNIIDSQKVCNDNLISNGVTSTEGYLQNTGVLYSNNNWYTTDYYSIFNGDTVSYIVDSGSNASICFYDSNKILKSCSKYVTGGASFDIDYDGFVRFSVWKVNPSSYFTNGYIHTCMNGNQFIGSGIQNIEKGLNDDNVSTSEASSFFSNFTSNNHGVSGIITAPLRLINSLATSTCSPLSIPLPFMNQNATLPCMSTIYSQFPTFYTLWQLITTGLIGYWVLIKIFGHIKGMQNPKDDRIEVLQL